MVALPKRIGVEKKKKGSKESTVARKNSTSKKSESRDAIKVKVNGMCYCHVARTMTYRRQEHAKYLFFFHCYHGFQIEGQRATSV